MLFTQTFNAIFVSFNRMPKENTILNQWKDVLRSHVNSNYLENLNGMICIHHFNEADITASNSLKKGVLPSIFPSIESNEDEHIELIEQNECCERIRLELEELRNEHMRLKLDHDVKVLQLKMKIKDLELSNNNQLNQIKKMNKQISNRDRRNEELEKRWKEAQENRLTENAKTTLEVNIYVL